MGAIVGKLTVTITGLDEAKLSAGSVIDALAATDGLGDFLIDSFPDLFRRSCNGGVEFGEEFLALFGREALGMSAQAASEGEEFRLTSLQIAPAERYVELVTAIAQYAGADIEIRHGWPILLPVPDPAGEAEAGGGVKPAPAAAPVPTGQIGDLSGPLAAQDAA